MFFKFFFSSIFYVIPNNRAVHSRLASAIKKKTKKNYKRLIWTAASGANGAARRRYIIGRFVPRQRHENQQKNLLAIEATRLNQGTLIEK